MSERLQTRTILVAGILLCTALGLVSIHVPFGRDQGVSAYVAEVMARGGAPYLDVYHFNLPGIFFAYLAARHIPLPWTESVNLFHLVTVIVTYLIVYVTAKQVMTGKGAAVASFFYGAFAIVMYTGYWNIAQKEGLACLPLSACLLAALKAIPAGKDENQEGPQKPAGVGKALLTVALAGLFAGFAAQFKPTLGIVLLACFFPAFSGRGLFRPSVKILSAACGGFLASFLPLIIYLVATDSLNAMVDSVFRFGGFYGGQSYQGMSHVIKKSAGNITAWIYEWRFLATLAIVAFIANRRDRNRRQTLVYIFGALLLFQLVLQMKYFTYHWIPLLIPAALLASQGASYLVGQSDNYKPARKYIAGVVLVLVALFLGNLVPEAKRYKREVLYDLGMISERDFLSPYGRWGGGDMCPLASKVVGSYIKENTSPEVPVLVFGLEPGLYITAGRFAPTRFAYDQPLVTGPGDSESFRSYRAKLREEFLADLSDNPPVYIIVIENDETSIEPRDSYNQMKEFAAFHEIINRDYYLETKIEDYFIFRRLGPGGSR